jgi:hypothetical protein
MGKALDSALARAWLKAADDLQIEVVAPFRLESGFQFVALVRFFGAPNGMLVLDSWDEERAAAAENFGFGFSCMDSPFYETYDRERFIEVLTDWTWTGDPEHRPDWYTESNDDGAI